MSDLKRKLELQKRIRVVGFDDTPFEKKRGGIVNIAGVVCSNTRFEGMLWGHITKDGNDSTDKIATLLSNSKFYKQVDVVLLDGIAVGGFNIIRLKDLYTYIQKPCIAVMRKHPDFIAINHALENFDDAVQRRQDLQQAGVIHEINGFVFQVKGCEKTVAASLLAQVTDVGHVPEALRLAHLIGAAVKTGESTNRA